MRSRRDPSPPPSPTAPRVSGRGGWDGIYAAVRRIPRGRVATYGEVAALAGRPGRARQTGYALHALPEHTAVPWHRVVNAQGRLSLARLGPDSALEQRRRLEAEGIRFDARGRIPLATFGWSAGAHRARPGKDRKRSRQSAASARTRSIRP